MSGGSSAAYATVTEVRVGAHGTYDRFVIQFSGVVATYTVTLQSGTQFTPVPKGGVVTLDGSAAVLTTMQHINWTAYGGPTSFKPGFTYLREARLIENFEGVQQWALGISGSAAIRAFTLDSPSRLVMDVTAR